MGVSVVLGSCAFRFASPKFSDTLRPAVKDSPRRHGAERILRLANDAFRRTDLTSFARPVSTARKRSLVPASSSSKRKRLRTAALSGMAGQPLFSGPRYLLSPCLCASVVNPNYHDDGSSASERRREWPQIRRFHAPKTARTPKKTGPFFRAEGGSVFCGHGSRRNAYSLPTWPS